MRPTARMLAGLTLTAASLAGPVGGAEEVGCPAGTPPLDPQTRLGRLEPQAAGTERDYCIFFGPYTIPPGQDLSRVDLDVTMTDGFLVAGGPSLALVDGAEPSNGDLHIHHAHWWRLDPDRPNYGPGVPFPGWSWISGAGEEETEGSFNLVSAADPDPDAPRYGLPVETGDRVLMINMIHNKTSRPFVVWLRVDLTFVHGTAAQIAAAIGEEFRALTPVLHGGTFDVLRGSGKDGRFVYPYDLSGAPSGSIIPGKGRLWTAPFSGTIVIGAGHLHPGGERVIFTNTGQEGDRCADTRTDGIPGTTLYELEEVARDGVRFSEEFQIEITHPGFRAEVKAGDELYLNGAYESAEHAWYEAMAFTGFYVDEGDVGVRTCEPTIVGTPEGWTPPLGVVLPDEPDPIEGLPNREWTAEQRAYCGVNGVACDRNLPVAAAGARTELVTVTGFQFLPGGLGLPGALANPTVTKGTQLRFVNSDIGAYIRHSVTSCGTPCDGEYVANYPLPDGDFDSRAMGYEPSAGTAYSQVFPSWALDTSKLELGENGAPKRYTYYCRIHPTMRGGFTLVAA